jgi:hypothetical protein
VPPTGKRWHRRYWRGSSWARPVSSQQTRTQVGATQLHQSPVCMGHGEFCVVESLLDDG